MGKPDDMTDYARLALDISAGYARMTVVGAEVERGRVLPYFRAIFTAYDRATKDEKAVIPTPLMAAIENARSAFGDCADVERPFVDRRMEPRHDDMTTRGTPLRPGA